MPEHFARIHENNWFRGLRSLLAALLGKKEKSPAPASHEPASLHHADLGGAPVIDLHHLVLLTRGDLRKELNVTNVFLAAGVGQLETLRRHLYANTDNAEWQRAAVELKSAAQRIGATRLAAACTHAEGAAVSDSALKETILRDIEHNFARVQQFFSGRF